MEENILSKKDPEIIKLFNALDKISMELNTIGEEYHPALNGERYITDLTLANKLKIAKRTLQHFRTHGKIPYYYIGGKVLYKESDIEKILDENYYQTFNHD